MASSLDPLIISDPKEQKWVGEISEILKHQFNINVIEGPARVISIFQVPETITTHKPEAYEPQQIGMGPNHHFRAQPYKKMEQKKIAAVQGFLQYHNNIKDFHPTILDKMVKLVPAVRSCYDMFLQDDNVSLAWVFTIDGLFLLNLFHAYDLDFSIPSRRKNIDPRKRLLAQDLMMVENQIPFIVLREINEALHDPSSGNNFSPAIYRTFSEIHSPLELCLEAPDDVEHLLHYMYYSIINNVPKTGKHIPNDHHAGGNRFLGLNSVAQVSSLLKGVPQKEMVQVYEQTITILQDFSKQKTLIPPASKLQGRSGYTFHALRNEEGIQKIHIAEKKKFYLPCITLNNNSEVILRNLIAYEMLSPNSLEFPLTEYMGLMCGLIITAEDVNLLRKSKIIKSELSDDEVAKLFVATSNSIQSMKTKEKSKLQKMITEVNRDYESRLQMKAYMLLKKLASWLLVVLKAMGSFVGATWKIVAFMVSIVTVFMLTYQAYCDVYGCDKMKLALSYASSM
uniref:putative UPF0481 protein At3g02645 n=1 Tax=Erigeron canadensis TaxID=72917 RepID=UPI001CB95C29|nr:putative UPF0481 protein At3g02645 [Erigeron canadensis]